MRVEVSGNRFAIGAYGKYSLEEFQAVSTHAQQCTCKSKAYKQTILITLIAHLIFTKMQCDALAQSLVITIKRKKHYTYYSLYN